MNDLSSIDSGSSGKGLQQDAAQFPGHRQQARQREVRKVDPGAEPPCSLSAWSRHENSLQPREGRAPLRCGSSSDPKVNWNKQRNGYSSPGLKWAVNDPPGRLPLRRNPNCFPLAGPLFYLFRNTVSLVHAPSIRPRIQGCGVQPQPKFRASQNEPSSEIRINVVKRGYRSLSNFSGAAIQPIGGLGLGEGGDGTGKEGLWGGGC